jgi:acyl-CoA thioester hydrolase
MGVVYHGNYIDWFEIGRTEYFREQGVRYKDLEEEGILLIVSNIESSYHYPARYDDLVTISTKVEQVKRTKLKFSYEIRNSETDKLLVTGKSTHAFVNQDFKPVVLQREAPEYWEQVFDKES